MNERLKELRKQAWKEAYNVDPDDPRIARAHKAMEEGMAKFAELIVKECIETMKRTLDTECINENEKYGCMYAIVDVKDHFGVYDDGDLTITFRS